MKIAGIRKRVINKLQRIKNHLVIADNKRRLFSEDFSLISQNCIGGVFYSDMRRRFLSPTINLFFSTSDFLKFVLHLKDYLAKELRMEMGEAYPMGYLDDLTIHFMHYHSCEEAKLKWEERKERINYDKIIVLCTDMEGFSEEDRESWSEIRYKKLLFTAKPENKNLEGCVFYNKYVSSGKVHDLIPKREFYKGHRIIDVINEIG